MRAVRNIAAAFCVFLLLAGLTACGAVPGDGADSTESGIRQETQGMAETETPQETKIQGTAETETPQEATAGEDGQGKILVVYFSATGNTRPIAEAAAELTGGDLFEIVPAEPYSEADLNYSDDNCRANREQSDSTVRPEISSTVENMEDYDVVLIGHPIWWGEEPRIIDTFVETYDLSGKTVAEFCTSGGSGIETAAKHLKELSPEADWLDGYRFETGADSAAVQAWLEELNLL